MHGHGQMQQLWLQLNVSVFSIKSVHFCGTSFPLSLQAEQGILTNETTSAYDCMMAVLLCISIVYSYEQCA